MIASKNGPRSARASGAAAAMTASSCSSVRAIGDIGAQDRHSAAGVTCGAGAWTHKSRLSGNRWLMSGSPLKAAV
jgi:hypothetical protein